MSVCCRYFFQIPTDMAPTFSHTYRYLLTGSLMTLSSVLWLNACSSAWIACRQISSALQASKIRMPVNWRVCTQKSSVCASMSRYPAETKEMQYQINKKSMYWYVLSTYRYIPFYESEICTSYILLTSSMYFKTYINPFPKPIENVALNSRRPHRFGLAFQL